jgi:hypothetical protein
VYKGRSLASCPSSFPRGCHPIAPVSCGSRSERRARLVGHGHGIVCRIVKEHAAAIRLRSAGAEEPLSRFIQLLGELAQEMPDKRAGRHNLISNRFSGSKPAEAVTTNRDVRSDRFSGSKPAEAVTTNRDVGSDRFSGSKPAEAATTNRDVRSDRFSGEGTAEAATTNE